MRINRLRPIGALLCAAGSLVWAEASLAQSVPIPGAADAGRVHQELPAPALRVHEAPELVLPETLPTTPIPEKAKNIHFVLHDVRIEGATAFAPASLREIYAPHLGHDITLDLAWQMAGQLTERYRAQGYFLSRAYVPAQRMKNGVLTLKVVEGYVAEVAMDNPLGRNHVTETMFRKLCALRPLKAQALESFLLRLNDLPGLSFRAVLSQDSKVDEAGVKLTLVTTRTPGKASVSVDNYGSRYLGPHEATLNYQKSFIPLTQTSITGLSAMPAHEMRYGGVTQSVVLYPDVTLLVNAETTRTHPAYTLAKDVIDSTSDALGVSLRYQWLRQRQENLSVQLMLDGRNTITDVIDQAFSKDRIRVLRGAMTYDLADSWQGYTTGTLTLSQGIGGLGASHKGDANLSREDAVPDFTKGELSLLRLQAITQNWTVALSASGQLSSNVLYSAEEFGYGGQAFGRAFDASDITGDDGLAGSVELRYEGLSVREPISFTPYVFWDMGKVWNQATDQTPVLSGSSAGFGLRFDSRWQVSGDAGVAFPLTREIPDPLYGGSSYAPRLMFKITGTF